MGKGMGGVYPMDLNGFDLLLGGKYCSHCCLVYFLLPYHISHILLMFFCHIVTMTLKVVWLLSWFCLQLIKTQFLAIDSNLEPIYGTPSSEKNPGGESSSAVSTETVTLLTSWKWKAATTARMIREWEKIARKTNTLINVSEALEEAGDMSDEEEVQVVLLSPDNPEVGDTDSELGNELDLVEQSIEQKFLERLKYKL